jgi:hypothetical protein
VTSEKKEFKPGDRILFDNSFRTPGVVVAKVKDTFGVTSYVIWWDDGFIATDGSPNANLWDPEHLRLDVEQ